MSRVIVLDTGPLGLITNPKLSAGSTACAQWLQTHITSGSRVIIPEIADYEVRRELLRANKTNGLAHLNNLASLLEYLPLTTTAMRQAAQFWAEARQQGQPTAGDKTIDGDVILAAQAITIGTPATVIATTNVGHLSRFIAAELWQNILPIDQWLLYPCQAVIILRMGWPWQCRVSEVHRRMIMSTLNVQLPDSLYKSLLKLAEQDGISIDQFIAFAVAEKISALATESCLRAKRGDRAKYEAVLAKVPDVEPALYDQLPPV